MATPHFLRRSDQVANKAENETPITIPPNNFMAWWDFTDESMLFTDVNRTQHPTNGDTIYWCLDKGPFGLHISQADAMRRPTYLTNAFPDGDPGSGCQWSPPSVQDPPDAEKKDIGTDSFPNPSSNEVTVAYGYIGNDNANREGIFEWTTSPRVTNTGYQCIGETGTSQAFANGSQASVGPSPTGPTHPPVTHVGVYDGTAGTPFVQAWRNQLAGTIDNTGVGASFDNTLGEFHIGFLIGNLGFFTQGNFSDVIVYDRAITTEERNALEEWLAGRTGAQLGVLP